MRLKWGGAERVYRATLMGVWGACPPEKIISIFYNPKLYWTFYFVSRGHSNTRTIDVAPLPLFTGGRTPPSAPPPPVCATGSGSHQIYYHYELNPTPSTKNLLLSAFKILSIHDSTNSQVWINNSPNSSYGVSPIVLLAQKECLASV